MQLRAQSQGKLNRTLFIKLSYYQPNQSLHESSDRDLYARRLVKLSISGSSLLCELVYQRNFLLIFYCNQFRHINAVSNLMLSSNIVQVVNQIHKHFELCLSRFRRLKQLGKSTEIIQFANQKRFCSSISIASTHRKMNFVFLRF